MNHVDAENITQDGLPAAAIAAGGKSKKSKVAPDAPSQEGEGAIPILATYPPIESITGKVVRATEPMETDNLYHYHPSQVHIDPTKNGRFHSGREGSDRQEFKKLVESILRDGQLQPVVVRPVTDPAAIAEGKTVELVFGFQRADAVAAANSREQLEDLGIDKSLWPPKGTPKLLECKLVAADDVRAYEMNAMENIRRRKLSPMDTCAVLNKLADLGKTQVEISRDLGMSVGAVSKYRRLATLDPRIQEFVDQGRVTMSDAERLLKSSPEDQARLAERIVALRAKAEEKAAGLYEAAKERSQSNRSKRSAKEMEIVQEEIGGARSYRQVRLFLEGLYARGTGKELTKRHRSQGSSSAADEVRKPSKQEQKLAAVAGLLLRFAEGKIKSEATLTSKLLSAVS